jgi:pilus assembly protein CpaB
VRRRSRGLALLGAAGICAGLAASSVSRYTNDVRAQVGPLVPVVLARADLARGTAITPNTAARALEVRRVPARYAPAQAVSSTSAAVGYRLAIKLDRGSYVTDSSLISGDRPGTRGDGAGRIVEIEVAGAGLLTESLQSGSHVDVLITTDRGDSAGHTYLALQDAELIGFSPGSAAGGPGEGGRANAALRVSLRQAVLLTAAQNFARELRLVPRADGDHSRVRAVDFSGSGLGR